ncbi:MAG: hypothetical protein IKN17_04030 [Ruminococcus sp.]|nr:hypothetical protein [Ruminococcus sp.]
MAAQTSLNRIRSYSKALSKNCRKQFVLILVLCVFSGGFYLMDFIAFGAGGYSGAWMDQFLIYATYTTVAAAVSGVLLMPALFRELYNRQYADVEFSLPLSAAERYKAKLWLIAKYHLMPYIIAQLMMLISGLIFLTETPASTVVSVALINISWVFFTDAVSLICISCCGCLAECIYTPVLFGAAISVIPVCFMEGLVKSLSNIATSFYFSFIPVGFLGITEIVDLDTMYFHEHILSAVLSCLISCGLMLLAFMLYKKRNGLSVGKPFVFKTFARVFPVLVTLAVIIVFMLYSFYNSVLFGLLAFLAISVSSKRRKLALRDIMFSMIGYISCLAAVIVTGFMSFVTGGFGYAKMSFPKEFDKGDNDFYINLYHESHRYAHASGTALSKSEIEELWDTVRDMDQRYSNSFSENLRAYEKRLRMGAADVYGIDSGTEILLTCEACGEQFVEYTKALTVVITPEQYDEMVAKLKEKGYKVETESEYDAEVCETYEEDEQQEDTAEGPQTEETQE